MEMRRSSGIGFCFFSLDGFLNLHIAKLFGVKDFATFQALNIFSIFVPGHNTHSWVFADGGHFSDSVEFERFSNLLYLKTPAPPKRLSSKGPEMFRFPRWKGTNTPTSSACVM